MHASNADNVANACRRSERRLVGSSFVATRSAQSKRHTASLSGVRDCYRFMDADEIDLTGG